MDRFLPIKKVFPTFTLRETCPRNILPFLLSLLVPGSHTFNLVIRGGLGMRWLSTPLQFADELLGLWEADLTKEKIS